MEFPGWQARGESWGSPPDSDEHLNEAAIDVALRAMAAIAPGSEVVLTFKKRKGVRTI